MNYTQQAEQFAQKFGVKLSIISSDYGKYFADDTQSRHIFTCKLQRGRKSYTFKFGQSIAAGAKEPEMYDILAYLQKHDPETFEDFCGNYGYDEDSRKAYKTYKAVCREWAAVERLFSDCLDELQEIN